MKNDSEIMEFPFERMEVRRLIAAAAKGVITMRELEQKMVLEPSDLRSMVAEYRYKNNISVGSTSTKRSTSGLKPRTWNS